MGKRVLVADDTDDMRLLLRMTLRRGDFDIIGEAVDGSEALQLWERHRTNGGLFAVILDHRMPGASGLEVARRIRAEDPSVRLIVFSAQMDDQLRAEAAEIGVDACLSKDELTDLVEHPALVAT